MGLITLSDGRVVDDSVVEDHAAMLDSANTERALSYEQDMEAPVTSTVMSDLPDEVSALKSQATVARPPTSDRERLMQYLRDKANRESTSVPEMAAIQNEANTQRAMIGALEGANTIFQGSLGNKVDPNAYATAKANVSTPLNDYLARRKAERDSESDKFQAVKEMADLESAANRTGAVKEYPNIEPGTDGRLHKVIKKIGPGGTVTQTVDLGVATEFEIEQSNKTKDYQLKMAEANRREGAQETKEAQKASDALLKYNIPGQENALNIVKKNMVVNPDTGEAKIPGFSGDKFEQGGLYLRMKADKLEPKELETRSAFQRLANQELKSQSGAAVTDPEYRRFLTAIQAGSWFDFTPAQVANYTGMLEQEITKKKDLIANVSQRGYQKVTGGDKTPPAATPNLSDKERRRQELLNKQKASQPKGG